MPTKKVVMAPLSINLFYADECLRYASLWKISAERALEALRDRDTATRSTMAMLTRQGLPQGEAMEKAISEHRTDWKSDPNGGQIREEQHSGERESRERFDEVPSKKQRTEGRDFTPTPAPRGAGGLSGAMTGSSFQGKKICKKWNDNRGCPSGESKCPEKAKHCCDALKPDGKVCGATRHYRAGHSNPRV